LPSFISAITQRDRSPLMTVITVPGVFFSLSSAGISLSNSVKSIAGLTALGLAIV
jgi:hypothetical protein